MQLRMNDINTNMNMNIQRNTRMIINIINLSMIVNIYKYGYDNQDE